MNNFVSDIPENFRELFFQFRNFYTFIFQFCKRARYLALGTIAVAVFAVRHGLPVTVVIAAPFLLILFALLALLALYAIIELCVRLAARRSHRARGSAFAR